MIEYGRNDVRLVIADLIKIGVKLEKGCSKLEMVWEAAPDKSDPALAQIDNAIAEIKSIDTERIVEILTAALQKEE